MYMYIIYYNMFDWKFTYFHAVFNRSDSSQSDCGKYIRTYMYMLVMYSNIRSPYCLLFYTYLKKIYQLLVVCMLTFCNSLCVYHTFFPNNSLSCKTTMCVL